MLDEKYSLQRWRWTEPFQAKQAANLSVIIYEHPAARPPEGMHSSTLRFVALEFVEKMLSLTPLALR
jgi:hypothetical protein